MSAPSLSWLDAAIVLIALVSAVVMLRPRIKNSDEWRATVTPLASIIGSGFLVIAPLLAAIAGDGAVYAMVLIILVAIWIGSALRIVIAHEEELTNSNAWSLRSFEAFSDIALAFAYVISIAFYIRLMAGFLLDGVSGFGAQAGNILATTVLVFIGTYGLCRGLKGLERLEEYSVTIKLAIIAGLLVALAYTDSSVPHMFYPAEVSNDYLHRLQMLGGMLLVVQGFETSKYLGDAYRADLRIRSMRWAQYLAAVIYIVFVALSMPLMDLLDLTEPSETAIIDLARSITVVLPFMLVIAAVMSQFSAAIADTLGSGGVITTQTNKRVSARSTYPVVAGAAIATIWAANVFELVALASRAFALYYLLQTIIALRLVLKNLVGLRRLAFAGSYVLLCVVLLAIFVFGKPITG